MPAAVKVAHLAANTQGRDFVIGDLHGSPALLRARMEEVAFNPAIDRILSVGDLIDRGPDSPGALALLDHPWFYAVCGNHDQALIDVTLYAQDPAGWLSMGGEWVLKHTQDERLDWALRLSMLPHILVIGAGRARYQLVHGSAVDVMGNVLSDEEIDAAADADYIQPERLQWSRALTEYYRQTHGEVRRLPHVKRDLSLTFVGHTVVMKPGMMLSHYFCDGGAGYKFPEATLHMLEVQPLLTQYLDHLDALPAHERNSA